MLSVSKERSAVSNLNKANKARIAEMTGILMHLG